MSKNLLIVGAGMYADVAAEIAQSMNCFEKIGFLDDERKSTPCGRTVVGKISDIEKFTSKYENAVVAIGNPKTRLSLLNMMRKTNLYRIVSLISPQAYIAPSAKILQGCIIEPMAVVQAGCELSSGCIVSAGAVINHASICEEGVHIDCNATVEGYSRVPSEMKICCGEVYKNI